LKAWNRWRYRGGEPPPGHTYLRERRERYEDQEQGQAKKECGE
jgi:hypothetical protein